MPGSYAILLFTASNLASITSHIHNWVLFLLWLHPSILSGVISPLISSSILGTYDYTVEVRDRFKGLDLIDIVSEELWAEVHDIVQETGIKTIPM